MARPGSTRASRADAPAAERSTCPASRTAGAERGRASPGPRRPRPRRAARPGPARAARCAPAPGLSADAVDLARRVGQVLGRARRPRRSAGPCCARRWCRGCSTPPGEPLVLPERRRDLGPGARARADARRPDRRGGYAVHGRPDSLLPSIVPASREPSDAGVLALALRLLLENEVSTRVLLHVGTPKTGTSYLQDVLFRNRERARGGRHPLPGRPLRRPLPGGARPDADALGRPRAAGRRRVGPAGRGRCADTPAPRSSATRSWRPPRARRPSGRSASLGHGDGTEVHLVISARDLVRQIPAEWQENVKHREELSYRAVPRPDPGPATASSRIGSWFWGVQELPEILDRWGHDLPPGAGPPDHRAAGRRPAAPAVGAVQHAPSASTASTSTSRPSAPTRRSASPRPR